MKRVFEHKSQPVLPFRLFLVRVLRYFLFAMLLIIISLGLGMLGYHHVAQISWIDSLLNASMILTGMGPVNEMTTTGAKVFASVYALFSGIVFLSTVAVFFAPIAHRLLHLLHVAENEE